MYVYIYQYHQYFDIIVILYKRYMILYVTSNKIIQMFEFLQYPSKIRKRNGRGF
jgi:hypothetical protein